MTAIQYISQLGTPAAGSAAATDLAPVTQGSTGAGTGTTRKMTLAEMAGGIGFVNVKAYGAVGNGVTDDTAAITARNTLGMRTYVPAGTYVTTIGQASIQGLFYGEGQIKTSDGNKRGKYVSQVSSAPSTATAMTSVLTAFNGDYSKTQFLVEHRITGATTLGQPTSGYRYVPEAYPFVGYLYNTSGYNHSTTNNEGRTSASFFRLKIDNYGQGDAVAYNASVFVSGARSGAASFLSNPAGSIVNGDIEAGAAGVYLNPFEVTIRDRGYDVAGVGWVVNSHRTNGTAALGAIWTAYLSQSKESIAIDSHFTGHGKVTIGLDLAGSDFGANEVAIAIPSDGRVYLAASNSSLTKYSRYTVPGDTWITHNSGTSGIEIAYASAAAVRVTNPASAVNLVQITGAATGQAPQIQAQGTDTNVPLSLAGQGTGMVTLGSVMRLSVVTFATLPSAATYEGGVLRISDRGQRIAYSDGTNWRFVSDDAVVT